MRGEEVRGTYDVPGIFFEVYIKQTAYVVNTKNGNHFIIFLPYRKTHYF